MSERGRRWVGAGLAVAAIAAASAVAVGGSTARRCAAGLDGARLRRRRQQPRAVRDPEPHADGECGQWTRSRHRGVHRSFTGVLRRAGGESGELVGCEGRAGPEGFIRGGGEPRQRRQRRPGDALELHLHCGEAASLRQARAHHLGPWFGMVRRGARRADEPHDRPRGLAECDAVGACRRRTSRSSRCLASTRASWATRRCSAPSLRSRTGSRPPRSSSRVTDGTTRRWHRSRVVAAPAPTSARRSPTPISVTPRSRTRTA